MADTQNANRARYLMDPEYHAAVELIVKVAILAVEDADKEGDDRWHTQWERRARRVTEALLDLHTQSLGIM